MILSWDIYTHKPLKHATTWWMHFHRDKLFTKGYISYDSVCETLLKWQNYRNGNSLAVSPRLSVGWGGWNVSVEKGQHDGPLVMGRPISWHPGSQLCYSFAWGLPLEETL